MPCAVRICAPKVNRRKQRRATIKPCVSILAIAQPAMHWRAPQPNRNPLRLPRSEFPFVMLILGVESSCDDTAAAVLKDGKTILSNVVSSQDQVHGPYGGVVPELA